jgi:predicted DsbA family dithiol-disulfide isomerase
VEKIRFHFDPRCPWCYQTARLAWRLEDLGEVSVNWAFFCLEVVNRAEGVDPLTIDARSGASLRTAFLVRERKGNDAVGALYRAIGARVWEADEPTEVDDLDALRDALREIGADPSLLDEALADPRTWEAVVQEHEALVGSTGAFGVPTIVLDDGAGPAIFGPVIYQLPDDDEARELWDHTVWLVRYGNFAELKRGRGGVPELPAMEYRVRQYQQRQAQPAAN